MTEDNLTRAEAQDRATKLSAVSYAVDLDLTAGEETFTSTTTVRFQANLHGISTFIDLDASALREATLNGRTIPVESYDKAKSRIPLRGLSANNELRIVADCAYQHTGVGMHRFADPTDGKVYLHTQFEPYDAHRVFACFDQPDIKATFTLNVTAPEAWTVIGNSPSTREGDTWRFTPTPVISTYLAAVVAGPYAVVRETRGDVELGIYCRESLASYLDADELFTLTRQGLDFFEEEFGYAYPFAKYDQLFVPEFNFGAMENPGCVTFNEYMVFRSRQTEAAHEGRANTLLHEMAHMWFGDLVTMRWWDDLWLNESFATYMATHALAQATRFSDSWVRFAAGTKAGAMAQDQLPSTHPISADIVDTDAVRLHFDGITYLKGASTLKQLVAWVGQEAFVEGLRRYFARHEWANATLADFLAVLEETSGRQLGPWSHEWLETAGVNTLRASFSGDDSYDAFAILQEGQPGNDTLRSHRVAIGLYRLGDKGLVRDRRVELDVIGARTEVAELVGETPPDLLLLNDDDLTYAKFRLDARSVATLTDHLSDIADPLARNLCWAAMWDMVRDGEQPTRRYVRLVLAHAPAETDDSTLARLLAQADTAVDVYGDPANRAAARSALAAAARAGLEAAEPGSDRQLIWARHLLSVADSAEDLAFARGILDGSAEVPGLAVDTDLRWQTVMMLASVGADDGGALIDAELRRDPTDIGERRAASARASRPTREAKESTWGRLVGEAGLPLATLRALAGGFHQIGQDELLAPYVDPYFDSLERFWDERTRDEALSLARGLFPGTLIGSRVVEATDRALARDTLPGPLRRILLESKDGMERALRARAADVDA
ncbi:MAG TPA: aminopeptidase N [Acidimicrobiales bacterium]|nr:aminopeptidase N [Acidimicrobiales bacterium]